MEADNHMKMQAHGKGVCQTKSTTGSLGRPEPERCTYKSILSFSSVCMYLVFMVLEDICAGINVHGTTIRDVHMII